MLGAIIGDIAGSFYEKNPYKTDNFDEIQIFHPKSKFTDDTVLTIAIADTLLTKEHLFRENLQKYTLKYPNAGYGKMYWEWANSKSKNNNKSYGNGAAMRISPIAYAGSTLKEVLQMAKVSSIPSHDHPEAILSAQIVAGTIFLARSDHSKNEILNWIQDYSNYQLDHPIKEFRKNHTFNSRSSLSIPAALVAFKESKNFTQAIKIAISLGGDSDTEASIAGAIAEAYYREIPNIWKDSVFHYLPNEFIEVMNQFEQIFIKKNGMSQDSFVFDQSEINLNSKQKCDFFMK